MFVKLFYCHCFVICSAASIMLYFICWTHKPFSFPFVFVKRNKKKQKEDHFSFLLKTICYKKHGGLRSDQWAIFFAFAVWNYVRARVFRQQMWRKCRILQIPIYRFSQTLYIGIVIKRTKIALLRGNFAKIRLANHIYRVCFICICVLPVPPRPSFPCRGVLARLFRT